jgi:hypothetical protein
VGHCVGVKEAASERDGDISSSNHLYFSKLSHHHSSVPLCPSSSIFFTDVYALMVPQPKFSILSDNGQPWTSIPWPPKITLCIFDSLKLSLHSAFSVKNKLLPYTLLMVMIMSMGWDHVSELRPLMGLFFIPQVIYEHGEPWWNHIDRGKLIRPPDLCSNSASTIV